ncbi:DinB family protein [Mangrovimonas aestuarii]|uniref:DinB family protein n=1 Tax=Mangrovimonas aestuarii TaxID=3018443 RepID=UPI00237837FE|nr:DinB family protein [Mangrovimonas aestuarii]
MKKSVTYIVAGLLLLSVVAFTTHKETVKSEEEFSESFTMVLEHARAYTLEVAEAMPAENYTFRPTEDVRSFGEQMAHIGMSTKFLLGVFVKGEDLKMDPEAGEKMVKDVGTSKEKCIETLNNAFDDAISTLKSMDQKQLDETFVVMFDPAKPTLTKKEAFLFLRDHITHHRGQAITTLRMKGEKAPQYRGY